MARSYPSQGEIYNGQYTPQPAGLSMNISSVSSYTCYYTVIGNIVSVFGTIVFTPTTSGTDTYFDITLPVKSNLTSSVQLAGTGVAYSGELGLPLTIYGNATNDSALIRGVVNTTSPIAVKFNYYYEIV